jgi:hypothetical protein
MSQYAGLGASQRQEDARHEARRPPPPLIVNSNSMG